MKEQRDSKYRENFPFKCSLSLYLVYQIYSFLKHVLS
jgi:hypothetical protein